MNYLLSTYCPGDSRVHAFDPRLKLLLLVAFSVVSFVTSTWLGIGALFLILVGAVAISKLPVGRIALLCVPLLVILLIIWLCNAFVFEASGVTATQNVQTFQNMPFGIVAMAPNIALVGSLSFSPVGAMTGLFYVARIVLMFVASFIVVLSTTSNELVRALSSLLSPLRIVRVPVDDVAMVFSLALRFIPLIAGEANSVMLAQKSRGASFGQGNILRRITAWFPVLIPLFVGLFRRAEAVSVAMDARCYGYHFFNGRGTRAEGDVRDGRSGDGGCSACGIKPGRRTSLCSYKLKASSVAIIALLLLCFVAIGALL